MATIIGGIAASHTPTIGFAYDRDKRGDPVWAPIFEAFDPVRRWVDERQPEADASLAGLPLDTVERRAIEETLRQTGDNKSEAARQLGITRATLHNKLRKYGLE